MSEEQQFCLRWNNFQANITSQFEALRDEEDFVDVTLACDGQRLKAHKVVLSACSPYFKELFKSNPCKHPILFLRDVAFHHLRALVEFMYAGEVNVAQAQLSAFLRTAESLQIRGLTEAPQKHKQAHIRQQQQQQPSLPPEVTASVGLDSSSAAEDVASSPECVGIDEDEDGGVSLSPVEGSSPNPAKRQCLQQDGGDATHQRTQTSTSSSHSDLRQELEPATKDSSADIVEPKMELPDYASDGDSKAGAAAFLGLDSNSVDVNASFAAALHGGGMDILPGPSGQSFLGEPSGSLDSGQVDHRKLHSLDPRPCPICNRMYSNLSNLRQHVRLIHNPQTVACPICSKPFKTKLYLKRHLMSFHEIFCGNLGPGGVQGGSKQGGEFYPPPPQVFLGPQSMGEEEERKRNLEGVSKVKEQQNLEIFQVSQASMLHTSLPHSGHDEQSRTHNAGKTKDPPSQPEVFHPRSFHSAMHHVTSHEDKSNIHNQTKSKHTNANMDLFQMPRIFHSIITSPSFPTNNEDKSNFMRSSSTLQHSKTKESQLTGQSFHADEEKAGFLLKSKDMQQGHNAELFQSPGGFPSASQAQTAGEEKASNFHTSSSVHTKNKSLTHPDLYHTGQSFINSTDGRDVYSTSADKEVPGLGYISQNHKDNQSFVSSSQTRVHSKIVNSDGFNSPKNEDNSSACTNFVGALSLASNDSARLALLTQSLPATGDEGLSFLDQKSSGGQDASAFLNESYSHTKCGQSESSMETKSLNHETHN